MRGETREVYTFWLEGLKGRNHLGYLLLDRRIILKWVIDISVVNIGPGFSCLITGSNDGLLLTR